jgi:hypothetical protein
MPTRLKKRMIATLGAGKPRTTLPACVDAGDGEPAEVDENDRADEGPEDDEELALLDEVGLAGLVDQLGDLAHRLVDRHLPDLGVRDEPEEEPERADREAEEEELVPVQAS